MMKHRAVSIGDKRAMNRAMDLVGEAIDSIDGFPREYRFQLMAEIAKRLAEGGFALSAQVTKET